MQTTVRVVFNTVVLYAKIIMSMAIALVSVPLVLKALGASDYGLYNLVAGIVAMLAFLNNSMTVSTQRYMSVALGEGNREKINNIYNASFILHTVLALGVVVTLEAIGIPSIGKLNIDVERIWCAHMIFQCLIISMVAKIIAVPFDAIMNAHEDMLAFSVIEVIDSLIMLATAFMLQYIPVDKLAFYGFAVSFISLLTLIMKYGWCRYAYKSYRISYKVAVDKMLLKDMLGFTGWNLFGGLAMMGRNQGVAVIFNLFLGTIANAAYGIANQINGALNNFSSTFQRAINPQLMKSEGMGNRERLQKIALISSKFSVIALCFISIPLIIEMDDVLDIWLRDRIPNSTLELSRCILILSILYQFSTGLMSAILATGKIKKYQITMGLLILTNVPVAYVILKMGYPIYWVTIGFIVVEFISLIVRVFMSKAIAGLSPIGFVRSVVFPCITICAIPSALCLIPYYFLEGQWIRVVIVCGTYGIIYLAMVWIVAFEKSQKEAFVGKLIKKIR